MADGKDIEAIRTAAGLMALSVRTAPKSRGEDFVLTKIVEGDDIERLADGMELYGEKTSKANFDRDARNLRNSPVVLLVGIKDATPVGLNCGACGNESCNDLEPEEVGEFVGPQCALRLLDMGIALGSAVKTASMLNVDNRIMYRVGAVARDIGMIDWDFVMGIPLSATGKSIYFDR